MDTQPITPYDIRPVQHTYPSFVIDAWNTLIKQNFQSSLAVVHYEDIVNALQNTGHTEEEILQENWLMAANLYHDTGWVVTHRMSTSPSNAYNYYVFKPSPVFHAPR